MIQENQKRKIVSIVTSSMLTVLVVVATFTYAFFTANTTIGNNLTITANVSDEMVPVFNAYSIDSLELLVTTADMLNTGANTSNTSIADADTQTLFVSLIAGSEENEASCTFDLYWKNLGATYVPSTALTASLKEYTIGIIDETGDTVYAETRVDTLQELMDSNNEVTLVTGATISSTGTLTEKRYVVTARIYNLNIDQNIYNTTFSSRIGVRNVGC